MDVVAILRSSQLMISGSVHIDLCYNLTKVRDTGFVIILRVRNHLFSSSPKSPQLFDRDTDLRYWRSQVGAMRHFPSTTN